VKSGETVEVAERGQLVALLVPPTPAATARDRLIEAGQLVPAGSPFTLPRRRAVTGRGSPSATLEEMRRERLG
jgi:antitoxin (DNA-binding transcriptional repressor) of toxin-antitoxin stability system